jgi:reprolysin-like metallo-peptidase family M12B/dockerin type I repeat protein
MKTRPTLFLAVILASTLSFEASAASNFWSANTQSRAAIPADKAVARLSYPKDFKLYNLNIEPLRQQLFSVVGNTSRSTVIVLPNANGQYEQFEVFEASNFEPDLQAQFPLIRAYSGKGITDKYATLKLSISPQGIQTMVFRTDKENEFIEAYSRDHTTYSVFKSHREKGKLPWTCYTEDQRMAADINSQLPAAPLSNTGQIKTMRLAQSCNGEYSNFFGAFNSSQVDLVLAAFNATLTRCNGCYEKDLAVHLNLIANTTAVIYYDPATDPYTSMGSWNGQLQTTLTANIGDANYDIGHMFGASGGGGNAGCIGCVCVNGTKGRGITSPADAIPMGDNFDIDYVVHEVGHQLGANHSFSFSNEGTSVQKEVGSGITIMGYAGITSQDVAPHSIDIFHEANIQQIQTNLANKTCPVTTVMTANHVPVVAPVSNFTIPITTPFALTGSATDPEGDPITYCWEQNDNSTTQGNASVASPTKLTGPNWLSFSPTASPTRLCPRLSTILSGLFVTPVLPGGDAVANIEALSSVSRTLNFRLTVRDNRPYVPSSTIGQTQFTDMTVTVTNTAGPFKVTAPNTNVSWAGGSTQTITWDVANTTLPPVSTANVKISLSTDGGQTFPTVLLASTPNDGSEVVTIPAEASSTARAKVEAVGNIFFDISDTNFSITGNPALMLNTAVSRKTHPGVGDFDVNLPLTGPPGIECRTGDAGHILVFTFTNDVTSGNASVTGGAGSVSGSPTRAANTMTVNLTGVTNGQILEVTLSNVTDSFGQVLPNTAVSVNFLLGDTTGNGSVNATDVSSAKNQVGNPVSASNFRNDINVNGTINSTDVSQVKANSGSPATIAGLQPKRLTSK